MNLPLPSAAFALFAASLLGGCAQGPDFRRPAAPPVAAYLPAPDTAAMPPVSLAPACAPASRPWWSSLGSARLDALVDDALAHSPTLDAARATLQQSEFSRRAGEGLFYPQLDLSLGFSRQLNSAFRLGAAGNAAPIFNLYTLAATIGYALDLFGVQRRAVEVLGAQADVQRYAGAAGYLSLSANVVNGAIAHAAYTRQLAAARRLVDLQADQLAIVRAQYASGLVAESDLQTQTQQLALARAALAPLAQRQAQARHLLSVLLGRPAAEALPALPELDELRLPAAPPLSLPSGLVRQRPDILQAEARMHAASAALGVATAVQWPTVTLGGDAGLANPNFGQLGSSQSRFWSIGPSASLPVFSGGSLSNQQKAAAEALRAAEADYRQVVLSAFGQVADVLTALGHDADTVQANEASSRTARRNWMLASTASAAGLQSRQQVQAAEIALQNAELTRLQGEALQLQDGVALYAAMGGAWWTDGPAWLKRNADCAATAGAQP